MKYLERNGAQLAYEDSGSVGRPVVLVHGSPGDMSFMEPVAKHLRPDCRVITLDLRGHGRSESGIDYEDLTLPRLAADVAWICSSALALEKPYLVGHSVGGMVAGFAAAQMSLGGLILLDAPIFKTDAFRALRAKIPASEVGAPDALKNIRKWIEEVFFLVADDPERKRNLVERLWATDPALAITWGSIDTADSESAVRQWTAPTLVVNSNEIINDMERFRSAKPDIFEGQTVGSGHFLQYEVPDQVNAMIDRFMVLVNEKL